MYKSIVNKKLGYNLRSFDLTNKIYNFSPGPAPIPKEILSSISDDLSSDSKNFKYGITPAEISHRSPEFDEIKKSAELELKKLMNIPNNFKILWTQGGGHGQFASIPLNMIRTEGDKINYIVTGTWSDRAYNEAKKFCTPKKIISSNFTIDLNSLKFNEIIETNNLEKILEEDNNYTYICSNETVNGLEYREDGIRLPKCDSNLIVDMSSDFLTKKVDWNNISVAFACTSKNLGMSGANIVVIDEKIFHRKRLYENKIPGILDWNLYKETDSLYNTPPIFNIYVIEKLLKYYNKKGIDIIENESKLKAELMYEYLDNNDLFYKPFISKINKSHRSNMNIPFLVCDGDGIIMEEFLEHMYNSNIVGLRTKTPFKFEDFNMKEPLRVSFYNGISVEDVKYLIKRMEEFKQKILYKTNYYKNL